MLLVSSEWRVASVRVYTLAKYSDTVKKVG